MRSAGGSAGQNKNPRARDTVTAARLFGPPAGLPQNERPTEETTRDEDGHSKGGFLKGHLLAAL